MIYFEELLFPSFIDYLSLHIASLSMNADPDEIRHSGH